jgi:zinc/manganese transport system substrate-binding protein
MRVLAGFVRIVIPIWLSLAASRSLRAEIRVVATVPDLAALAREVGGELVTVRTLSLPTQDPHFVDAKPSLALELNRADLLLLVGLDLEVGWLPTLLIGSRNPEIQPGARGHLDCSQFVSKLDVPGQPVDRSQGDIHPTGNPHYLYDPRAGERVAMGIARRLAQIDPGQEGRFRSNADALVKRLAAARAGWEKTLAPFRGSPVVGYHKTWSYLCDWLGFEQVGWLEAKPGVPPNPRHVAQLLGLARQRKVRLVLQEEHYPDSTSRLVAGKIPAPLLRLPAATNFPAGETYLAHVGRMVAAMAKALGAAS